MTPLLELGRKKIHGERSARCLVASSRPAHKALQRGSISIANSIEQISVWRDRERYRCECGASAQTKMA